MKRHVFFIGLSTFCIVAILLTGCTGQDQMKPDTRRTVPTPPGTVVQVGDYRFSEDQNNAIVHMKQGTGLTLSLDENPTTGYQWNLTTTPGLNVTRDVYIPLDAGGKMVGSGGTHWWDISADGRGPQTIQAIYKRSWEPVTGNETTFRMTIIVE